MRSLDVVVVGGGAAGCAVAARLAEAASCSVLLVEAGPDRRNEMPAALRDGWTIERETFDWGYVSASEPPKPVRRKRVVGGTSWLTRSHRGPIVRLRHDCDRGHRSGGGSVAPYAPQLLLCVASGCRRLRSALLHECSILDLAIGPGLSGPTFVAVRFRPSPEAAVLSAT